MQSNCWSNIKVIFGHHLIIDKKILFWGFTSSIALSIIYCSDNVAQVDVRFSGSPAELFLGILNQGGGYNNMLGGVNILEEQISRP